ncbi:MAG: transporter substrate-binding domain-containing protein [Fibrobacterales bacterium]
MKIILILLTLLATTTSAKDTLKLATIDYCPFSCNAQGPLENKGFLVDIMYEIARQYDTHLILENFPFNRYLTIAKSPEYDGLIIMGKDHVPDLIYPKYTAGSQGLIFLKRANFKWEYTGIPSLKKVTVGTIKNFKYCDDLGDYLAIPKKGSNIEQLLGTNSINTHIQKLSMKRIDLYIEGEFIINYALSNRSDASNFSTVDPNKCRYNNYTAFNPNFKQASIWADRYSKEIMRMKKDGRLREIMSEYGLKPILR